MMSNEYQKELFEEFKKEKSKFKKITDKLTQRRPKFYINLPLENIVVTTIIIIMCIIVSFALGVERGKRSAKPQIREAQETTISQKEPLLPQKEISSPLPAQTDKEAKFTIQLISYRQQRLAEDEKKKLLNKEMDAFIIPLGNWYQVCAGGYSTMDEAKIALNEFKKEYKECFIRKK